MTRFSVLCIALISIVHWQSGTIWSSANNFNPVCNTTECQRLGKYYLQNIDTTGYACDDFYDYVCSNWGMHNSRPKELNIQYLWNVDHHQELRSLQEMRKLLESKGQSKSSEFEQAKFLYKTCMSIPYMERSSPSSAWDITRKASVFPILNPKNKVQPQILFFWEIDQKYIETTGESALYDFYPLYDTKTNEIMTNLESLPSPYGSLVRPVGWTRENELESYKAFLTNMIRSVVGPSMNISKEVMDQDLDDVITFREKLNAIISKYASSDKTEIVTIQKFQNWYSTNSKSSNSAAEINWLNVIRAMYQKSDDPRISGITERSKVRVHTTYFLKLADLLRETNKRTLVNHIHLFFLERHVEWTPQMKSVLVGSVAGCGLFGIVMSENPRWKKCIETNNLRTAIGKAYVSSFFPPAQKAKVVELFQTMKSLMKIQISQSTWLNNSTKVDSINKLAEVKGSLGYPDQYDSPTSAKLAFTEMDPIVPLTLYMHELNRVIISAARLQWPIYSPNVPYVIDYGSLGAVMGHELYHVFDADGVNNDAQGKSPFWSKTMLREYHMKTLCFTKQYNKYKDQEMRPLTKDTVFTTQEDIPDVMGLKLAYAGFKEMVKKNNGVCPILPGFETYSCDQLFFIAFANTQCSASLPGYNEMVWFRNGENWPKIKINGAVANMKEFSTAFKCRKSDTLNLEQTCDLWQR